MTTLSFLVLLICLSFSNGNKVINRYDSDNDCALNLDLVEEIKSYKAKADRIINEVINNYGDDLYQEYTNFIDTFGQRPSGSEVLENSIDYMINLTKVYGNDDVTTEEVVVPHWVRGEETLEMITPRHKKMQILGLGSSVSTPAEGITGEVIVVKSFEELENLHNDNVKGKIVVFNPDYVSYPATVVFRSQGAVKAALKGAVAALVRSVTPFSLYTPHTGHQSYSENVTKIPSASLTVEDAQLLWRLQSRGKRITLKLKMSSTSDTKTSRNVLVDLKGEEFPKKQVIVSGHIDSWDVGEGAMDDGGGMFISWAVPAVLNKLIQGISLKKPRRTIRAILWTAEEPGLIGAFSYLNKHKNELSDINFMMESDEGTFKPLGLEVAGTEDARCIIAEILKLFKTNQMKVSNSPGSDISIFMGEGVPGASLINQNEKYFWFHHTEADTMEVQSKKDVIECAAFWTAVSYIIADLSADIPR